MKDLFYGVRLDISGLFVGYVVFGGYVGIVLGLIFRFNFEGRWFCNIWLGGDRVFIGD